MIRHTNRQIPPIIDRMCSRRIVLGLVLAVLGLLVIVPGALAFQTRTPIGSFGSEGAGTCSGLSLATGSGDLSAASGTGDAQVLANGTGEATILADGQATATAGSTTVTNLKVNQGTFTVGESIFASQPGILPEGGEDVTITAVGAGSLTLSQAVMRTGSLRLLSGSRTLSNVTTQTGAFTVGESISDSSGNSIPDGTTITAVGAGTLTLSRGVTNAGSLNLTSGSKTLTNVANSGDFSVGWGISGNGLQTDTTITAVGAGTLTLSRGVRLASSKAGLEFTAGSTQVDNLNPNCGTFAVGQVIEGIGIPDETTITSIGTGSLTISAAAREPGTGVQLTATSSFRDADAIAATAAGHRLYVLDTPFAPLDRSMYAFDLPTDTPAGGAFPLLINQDAGVVAIDATSGGSAGNVYYTGEAEGSRIFGLNSAGAPLGGSFPISASNNQAGIGVDSKGTIWVANSSNAGSAGFYKYNSTGSLGSVPVSQAPPRSLAFDSNDDIYAPLFSSASESLTGIWRFTAASGYKTGTQIIQGPTGDLAIDRSTHTLYVVQNFAVSAYDLNGTPLYGFGVVDGSAQAVAVDESANQIYVAEGHRVRVYGALADFPDATATVQPATNVGATTAELHATIDDNSALPTRWRIQVSKDGGATWVSGCDGFQHTHGGQSGLAVSCIATQLQSNTDYRFRAITEKGGGSSPLASSDLGFHTDLIPPASATLNPAANLTAESADLSATIDDNGPLKTAWHFEISSDNGQTWTTPAGVVSGQTDGGQSGVAVSGTAEELDPNTEYLFRIVTKKDPGAPDEFSSALSFLTLTAPPTVANVGAVQITDVSASLAGEVHPRNLQTTYSFHYGTTPALGSSTVPVELGGNKLLIVSQPITGLVPDTDYYFKLLASNLAGASESALVKFHTRALPLPLPEDRAYEQVSPVDKNFGNAGSVGGAAGWDGQGVSFSMFVGLGDPAGQIRDVSTYYLSRRHADGWHTRWLGEPGCTLSGSGIPGLSRLSPNFDYAVITHPDTAACSIPPLDSAAPVAPVGQEPYENLYLGNYAADPVTYQLLNPKWGGQMNVRGMSADASHVVYENEGLLTPDAPAGNFSKLYDWHNGSLDLVSKDTANQPFTNQSTFPFLEPEAYQVSADGSRIFFYSNGEQSSREIYMRQNDATTYWVSQPECAASCGQSAVPVFRQATPLGNKVIFTTTAKLRNEDTSSAGQDLYLYTQTANPAVNTNLTLISKDSEPADGTKAEVGGTLGMSDDGDTVFFVAYGQLVAGEPIAPGPKVYRWRRNGGSPTLEYLATLGTEPNSEASQWTNNSSRRISTDGDYLLLYTTKRLNVGADHDADRDIYRWDAKNGWICVSCQPPEVPSAGNVPSLRTATALPKITDDGQRIFFTAYDSLVPADPSNGIGDVYEWHDGALSLISTGAGPSSSELIGASRSGNDVFFTTYERLVGWDTDDNADIYDARVGGGFPEPPPTGVSCEGEACRGAVTVGPTPVGAGSAAFEGPGNTARGGNQQGCPKGKARRKGRCVAKKAHHKKRQHKRAASHDRRATR